MPLQLLCRLAKCIIFYFFSILKLQFHFCHICVILLLLSEINCIYVYVFLFFYVHTPSHYSPPLMMNTKCELSVPLFSVKYIYLFGTGELFRQSFGAPIDVKQY